MNFISTLILLSLIFYSQVIESYFASARIVMAAVVDTKTQDFAISSSTKLFFFINISERFYRPQQQEKIKYLSNTQLDPLYYIQRVKTQHIKYSSKFLDAAFSHCLVPADLSGTS